MFGLPFIAANDNNARMAQLLLHGTNFVNFVGYNARIGGDGGVEAVQVTEWDEPQTVIGSYLQKYAYPDYYDEHQKRDKELTTSRTHNADGAVNCVTLKANIYSQQVEPKALTSLTWRRFPTKDLVSE